MVPTIKTPTTVVDQGRGKFEVVKEVNGKRDAIRKVS